MAQTAPELSGHRCAIKSLMTSCGFFFFLSYSHPVSLCCTKTCLYPSVREVLTGVAGCRDVFKTCDEGGWVGGRCEVCNGV